MKVRRLRPVFLLLGLLLLAQFPDEVVRAAPLQATSISLSMSNPSLRAGSPAEWNLLASSCLPRRFRQRYVLFAARSSGGWQTANVHGRLL